MICCGDSQFDNTAALQNHGESVGSGTAGLHAPIVPNWLKDLVRINIYTVFCGFVAVDFLCEGIGFAVNSAIQADRYNNFV